MGLGLVLGLVEFILLERDSDGCVDEYKLSSGLGMVEIKKVDNNLMSFSVMILYDNRLKIKY